MSWHGIATLSSAGQLLTTSMARKLATRAVLGVRAKIKVTAVARVQRGATTLSVGNHQRRQTLEPEPSHAPPAQTGSETSGGIAVPT